MKNPLFCFPFKVHNVPFHVLVNTKDGTTVPSHCWEKEIINLVTFYNIYLLDYVSSNQFFEHGQTPLPLKWNNRNKSAKYSHSRHLPPFCQSSGVFAQFTFFSKLPFKNVGTYGKVPDNRGKLMLPSNGFNLFDGLSQQNKLNLQNFPSLCHSLSPRKFSLVCT